MKHNIYRKFRGGLESSRSRTPDANAPSEQDRISRRLRGQYKARRYQLMDGAR